MYFKNYNPTLHDVYLYGPGNTGYPIGLNPNCLIYDARKSYQAISLRERSWGITGPIAPTAGTPFSQYSNYYNIGYPLFWWVSKTMLGACTHFSSDTPCDSIPGENSFLVKETGMTGNYGRYYWDENLSTKTFYNNFEGIFNCVGYEPYADIPRYFQGWSGASTACEEQAPGYGTGSTFYQITTTDYSFSKLRPTASPNNYTGKVLRTISPLSVITHNQVKGITQYIVQLNSTNPFELGNIVYEYPVNDVYFWGGNDTIQPVSKIRLGYRFTGFINNSIWDNSSISYKRGPFISIIFDDEEEATLWTGDSSGLLLYKKNNELFSIMSLLTSGGRGDLHSSTILPPTEYLISETDINAANYFYSNRSGGTYASKSGFTALQIAMASALVAAQNKYAQLISLPQPPSGFTAIESSDSGITFSFTDNSNNELGFKIFYYTPEILDGDVIDVGTIQINTTELLVSWGFSGDSSQLTGFEILRANSPLSGLTFVANDVRGYIDSGLNIGTTYTYAIRGYRGFDATPMSSFRSKRVVDVSELSYLTPETPENVVALTESQNRINVSWTKGSGLYAGEPEGYIVYNSLDLVKNYKIVASTTGATSYVVRNLNPDTRYFFKIEAHNPGGTSARSAAANATTPPQSPRGFVATAGSTTNINLSWNGYTFSSPINSSYNIYRSTDGNTFSLLENVAANSTGYINSNLLYGQTYWYRINAQNAGGTSTFSQTLNLTPLIYPNVPQTFNVEETERVGATFSWIDTSNNEFGFKLFYYKQ